RQDPCCLARRFQRLAQVVPVQRTEYRSRRRCENSCATGRRSCACRDLLDEVGELRGGQREVTPVGVLAVSHGDPGAWCESSQLDALVVVRATGVRTLTPLDGCHVRSSGRCLIRSIRSANSAVVRVRWLPSGFLLSRTPMPDESCPSSTQCSSLTPLLWVLFRHWMVMC